MSTMPRTTPAAPLVRTGRRTVAAACVLSLVAAGVHMLVTPEHFAAWWGYGMFFVVVANVEIALACLLVLHPSRWILRAGLWSTMATLLMYFVSRTSGIPLGPDSGMVEEVETLGLIATVAEAGMLVAFGAMLADRERSRTLTLLALVGAGLWVASLSGALTPSSAALEQGHEHGHGAATESAHTHTHARGDAPLPFISDRQRNKPR